MSIGIWQILLVLVIVLIIFGAGKLPRVMGDLGKGIKSFKKGMDESDGADGTEAVQTRATRLDDRKDTVAEVNDPKEKVREFEERNN